MENREIKFKIWVNNKWSTNLLVQAAETLPNCGAMKFCQFTGLVDGNGKEIFEGDIIEIVFGELFKTSMVINGSVVFKFGGFHVEFINPKTKEFRYVELFKLLKNNEKVVIGNICENPELLTNAWGLYTPHPRPAPRNLGNMEQQTKGFCPAGKGQCWTSSGVSGSG